MKNRERNGRLVTLLAEGFLGFTAAVVAVTIFTIWLSNTYYARLTRIPDVDGLCQDSSLLEAQYEKISVEKYLGKEGALAVIGADGQTLYRTVEAFDSSYTAEELDCIQSYGEYSYVEYTSFAPQDVSQEGTREYLFIRHTYEDGSDVREDVMILNDHYEVIGGGFGDGRKIYTPKEFGLLTGEAAPGYELLRCQLDEDRTLLVLSKARDFVYYNELIQRADRVFLVVIPLYIIVLSLFLIWISRKIKNPLVALNQVIESRVAGNDAHAGNLKGPWEIRQIGRTFDRLTDRLEKSERERRRMDEERQKMLAAISHDLKTPITVISGYTRAVRDGKIPQEQMDSYLERIDGKATELNELISSFHEFSKVEHPDFSLQMEKTDACEFLRTYLAERYDDIDFHGFHLEADIPEDCKLYSMIDCHQMRRALDNILYNTLRHNRLGTVLAVGISQVNRGPGGMPCIRIFIADNGSGIPEGLRSKIFEPFVMGDESRTGRGSGLGLSITRNIIQSHGGQVRLCETESGFYSTEFEILLRMIYETKS